MASSTMEKIKVAIVGFGGMANYHLTNMRACGLFDVVGVYDIDEVARKRAISKGLKAYASFEELTQEPNLKLVLIATPNDVHAEYAVRLANAGINVLCEKPVTLSSVSLQSMIDAAKANNVLLTVHQNRRWDKDYLIIKQLYDNSPMGAMYKVDSNVTGSHGLPGAWRRIKAKGGGMLLDWGVHLIDQMLVMNPSKVVGVTCRFSFVYGFDCDDGIYLTLDFADGFVANINIDTNKFVKTPRWYAYGLDGTAIIRGWNCRGKVVRVKQFNDVKNKGIQAGNGFTKTMADRSKSTVSIMRLPKVKPEKHAYYKNLYAALTSGATPAVTMDGVMRCMQVMEAGFRSVEEKKTIVTNI